MCIAADSNVLIQMQKERLESDTGEEGELARHVLNHTYLALDIDGHCLHEACECINGPFSDELRAWVTQLENDGKLRRLAVAKDGHFIKKISQGGLPKKDQKWASLGKHECVNYILTEDIDFYHPSDKSSNSEARERRKNNRNGEMLKLLRKEAFVEVVSPRHIPHIFE